MLKLQSIIKCKGSSCIGCCCCLLHTVWLNIINHFACKIQPNQPTKQLWFKHREETAAKTTNQPTIHPPNHPPTHSYYPLYLLSITYIMLSALVCTRKDMVKLLKGSKHITNVLLNKYQKCNSECKWNVKCQYHLFFFNTNWLSFFCVHINKLFFLSFFTHYLCVSVPWSCGIFHT